MPYINGQKVACGSCIRGHRAGACSHAHNRVMIPVRPAGRPPTHADPCPCREKPMYWAAIPLKSKCHCETKFGGVPAIDSSKYAAPLAPSVSSSSCCSSEPVKSPTNPSPQRSRPKGVQQRKSQSNTHTRQMSQDEKVSNLRRMDPNQLNIISNQHAPGSQPQGHPSSLGQFQQQYPGGGQYLIPQSQFFITQATAMNPSPQPYYGTTAPYGNGSGNPNGQAFQPSPPSSSSTQLTPSPPTKSMDFGLNGNGATAALAPVSRGCCSTANSGLQSAPLPAAQNMTGGYHNGTAYLAEGFALPPNVYAYPAMVGSSFDQPLQYDQWQRFVANSFTSQFPFSSSLIAPTHPSPSTEPNKSSPSEVTNLHNGAMSLHQCGCGPGCACVGCAAHPYNEPTKQYVYTAWDQQFKTENLDDTNEAFGQATMNTPPSDESSPSAQETINESGSYLYVAFENPMICSGDATSCSCGDNCSCIGCLVHGNPGRAPSP
ncbi:hypothetical protein F5Y16DRAFT_366022 [Xylariaceae sp. FL0255]|nr:hypothetical protein F5Y16DRAFT_366022 [Xylariaceae sp. FL0255]